MGGLSEDRSPHPESISGRRALAKQQLRDRALKSSKKSQHEIHLRWPYELWLRRPSPNSQGHYVYHTRALTEREAVRKGLKIQQETKRKCLIFYHPTPESERVLVWNDLNFREEMDESHSESS